MARRRQLHDVEDDVDAFSEEMLDRRPEVRIINTHAILRTFVVMGLKGISALMFVWASAVLLGGFVSSVKKKDFWCISFIAFVEAGGIINAVWDRQFDYLDKLLIRSLLFLRVKHNYNLDKQRWYHIVLSWLISVISKINGLIVFVVIYTVLAFIAFGPVICAGLSLWRLTQPDYGRPTTGNTDANQANLKPGLDSFYFLSIAQGLGYLCVWLPVEFFGAIFLVWVVSLQVGLSRNLVLSYYHATRIKYMKNPAASTDEIWNFITYGAGLLDSEMPEENASGSRVLTTLIEQGVPVRRQLLRSPRQRIQKMIATLAWTSPAEEEMRWLSARIVEHVAPGLSLAQFPGALECISSLLDTSGCNKGGDQEVVDFVATMSLDKQQGKQMVDLINGLIGVDRHGAASAEETNEDLIFQGQRILENLALDQHNCKVICSTDDGLFSKIVAPVCSENLIQDISANTASTKVTYGSMNLVSQLMRSHGDTGKEMCRKVADNSRAVNNLEEVLALDTNSFNITVLQIGAIEILEQLCSGETASSNWDKDRTRANLSMKALHIFLTDKWMEDCLLETRANLDEEIACQLCKTKKSKKSWQVGQVLVPNKVNAQDTVSQLKEKAGEALAKLCMGNQISSNDIMSFTGRGDVVQYLTEMLGSNEKTVRCWYSAAVILKHLCTHCSTLDEDYLKETTLKKVLREFMHIKTELQATSTNIPTQRKRSISQGGYDIEKGGGHDERLHVRSHKQQHEEMTLQVALLSLCAAIRGRWIDAPEFARLVAQLVSPEDLAEKLEKIVEEIVKG